MTRSEGSKHFSEKVSGGGGHAAVLYFQIRLHEGRGTGLCVALDTWWATSSASIGCSWIVLGGGSFGGGIALFALNFIIWRRDRRIHPGLAPGRGGLICAIDHVLKIAG